MPPLTQVGALRRDDDDAPVMGGTSSVDNLTIVNSAFDPTTRRLLVTSATGSGSVTSVSVVTANGFAGTVATATTTPAITLTTTATGILQGNGTAISAITVGAGLSFIGGTLATTGGSGTVTTVSVVTANGVSGSVANPTTTPAITLTLGAITPTTVNGNTITTGTGTLTLSTFTLTVAGTASISGTNTGDQTTVSGNAGSSTLTAITDDTTTNATMFPTWVTTASGNQAQKVSSTELTWNPSTGVFNAPILQATTDLTLVDASAPTKASGKLFIYSQATNGASRPTLVQNLGSTNFILGRDNTTIVRNSTGATLTKGQAVYVSGNFVGIIPTGAPARADSITTLPCIGIVVDDFAPNNFGFIMKLGVLSNIDTSAFAVNDILYVSPTVAGGLTNVRPSGTTNFVDPIAVVFKSDATTGQILVRAVGALFNRETGTNAATWTGSAIVGTTINATTGFQVAGAATSGNVLTGNGTNFVSSAPAVALTNTVTLTNKRITRRSATTNNPGATPTTNSDNVDVQIFTGMANNVTSFTTNLSGTPVATDFLEFWLTDNGTPRTLAWGASFAATTVALPITTVTSTKLRVLFEWGGSTWDCVAVA